ncbi:MAG: hypothetical protein EOP45_10290 [Sphingobacteriaceae bacterium]|nr:MAG: hypothetical protein EOP45_10290 [Sphingobacteriaceae bacterium]
MDYTKLVVHLITLYNQKYFNLIGKSAEEQRAHHHEWMKLIFSDFNDVATPKDLHQTEVTSDEFMRRLQAIGDKNTKAIISILSNDMPALKNALQLIMYHCIQHIRQHRSPLNQVDFLMNYPDVAIAIKEPTSISEHYLQQQIDGMFTHTDEEIPMIPFVTIYGPSVLHGLDPIKDRFDDHLTDRLKKLILDGIFLTQ